MNDQTIAASTAAFSHVLKNLYNHLLESYLGVLSSTSSNILHTLFQEVLNKHLCNNELATDLRIYLLKIADKIITICSGDLLVHPPLLNALVEIVSSHAGNEPVTLAT